jgi:hypothetical protein
MAPKIRRCIGWYGFDRRSNRWRRRIIGVFDFLTNGVDRDERK